MNKEQGASTVEYLIVIAALFLTWNFVSIVKDALITHQAEYTWSLSQPDI